MFYRHWVYHLRCLLELFNKYLGLFLFQYLQCQFFTNTASLLFSLCCESSSISRYVSNAIVKLLFLGGSMQKSVDYVWAASNDDMMSCFSTNCTNLSEASGTPHLKLMGSKFHCYAYWVWKKLKKFGYAALGASVHFLFFYLYGVFCFIMFQSAFELEQ